MQEMPFSVVLHQSWGFFSVILAAQESDFFMKATSVTYQQFPTVATRGVEVVGMKLNGGGWV